MREWGLNYCAAVKFVNDDIINPPQGISNISEWCKKDACWSRLQSNIEKLEKSLPDEFWNDLVSLEEQNLEGRDARKTQKIDNGIDAQKKAVKIPANVWSKIMEELTKKHLLSPKEMGILEIACQIPDKIPSEKQSVILMDVLEKASAEGVTFV